jgi:hypothetical protein
VRSTLMAFLLLTSTAFGQATPPPIPIPAPAPVLPPGTPQAVLKSDALGPVAPGAWVTLDASATVGDDLDWDTDAPDTFYRIDTGKRLVYFSTTTPGSYPFKVLAIGSVDGKLKLSKAKVTIQVGPAPLPTPVIPVAPVAPAIPPFAGKLHATLVFDLDEPSTAPLRISSVKADLALLGTDWYVAPSGGDVAKLFSRYTVASGLPTVYITDDAGAMRGTVKAPTSKDQVVAEIKAIRGGTN